MKRQAASASRVSLDFMFTIEQISHITGVPKTTLRYWEKSFDEFLKPARTPSNRREYSLGDLDLVKAIKRLLGKEHLTAQGVRLRLVELFSPGREAKVRRKVKPAREAGERPAPSP